MVFKFVRDQYPQARFKRIYNAKADGWRPDDFHRCCNRKGWSLTIVLTTDDFIFGAFAAREWDSTATGAFKTDPNSFMFSVNEGSKYRVGRRGDSAIYSCESECAELLIAMTYASRVALTLTLKAMFLQGDMHSTCQQLKDRAVRRKPLL
jgi:hypothetical protein